VIAARGKSRKHSAPKGVRFSRDSQPAFPLLPLASRSADRAVRPSFPAAPRLKTIARGTFHFTFPQPIIAWRASCGAAPSAQSDRAARILLMFQGNMKMI
jgi:hypothetical protein